MRLNMMGLALIIAVCAISIVCAQAQPFQYNTYPLLTYTFDAAPPASAFNAQSGHFTWSASSGGHNGIANFNSTASDFLNLVNFRDATNNTMPLTYGGSMSIEFAIRFNGPPANWARIIDYGPGPVSDNVWLGRDGDSTPTSLRLEIFSGADITTVKGTDVFTPNTWLHVICSIQQRSPTITTGNAAANSQCFINGQLVAAGLSWLPRAVARANAFIGRSNWVNDPYLSASIDAIYFYNYGIGAEPAAVHAVVRSPPMFELAFNTDPRPWVGLTNLTAGYTWALVDSETFNGAAVNTGVVTFNGRGEYIDLNLLTGRHTVGTLFPRLGALDAYSFEVLFKVADPQFYARIFDFASTNTTNDGIHLSFRGDSNLLEFVSRNAAGAYNPLIVLDKINYGEWVHVVVTISRNADPTLSTQTAYVNGVRVPTIQTAAFFPRNIERPYAFLGRSAHLNTPDEFFNGTLDAFRVYPYVLDGAEIQKLFSIVRLPPLYTSGPRFAYTFDNQIPLPNGTKYTWQQTANFAAGGSVVQHSGLARFGGIDDQIDLHELPDRLGRTFPYTTGGAFAIETWISFQSFASYARLLEISSAARNDRMFICSWADTPGLAMAIYDPRLSAGWGLTLTMPDVFTTILNGLGLNRWYHLICSVGENHGAGVTPVTAGVYACYLNGQVVGSTYALLPPVRDRTLANIGQSLDPWDGHLNATIDAWYYYDHSLQLEEAQIHYLLQRPPVYELSFASDPRLMLGIDPADFKYGWQLSASSTYNDTSAVGGVITMDGDLDHYVNLAQTRGPYSVGTSLPVIGGSGSGSLAAGTLGWTFEVSFLAYDMQSWSRIFDLSQGDGSNAITFSFISESAAMQFNTQIVHAAPENVFLPVISNLIYNQWYHVVITVQPNPAAPGLTIQRAYVNGVQTANISRGLLIEPVERPFAYLGRGSFNGFAWDENFNGTIDRFSVYDYVLDDATIARIYGLVQQKSEYTSGPTIAHTFDFNQTFIPFRGQTNYTWRAGSDAHLGLASFDGVRNNVDLYAQPDRYFRTFPARNGGSFSFESWAQFTTFNTWGRIVELATKANDDNIVMGSLANTNGLALHIYNDYIGGNSPLDVANMFVLGRWHHVICSVTAISGRDPNTADAARYMCAVDGKQVGSRYGALPEYMSRSFAFIGRSSYESDQSFNGVLDSFYYYDYGLSAEQAAVHYLVPRPPIFEAAFSNDPRLALLQVTGIQSLNDFGYTWIEYDENVFNNTYQASGIIALNGVGQYIDLAATSGKYSIGTSIPTLGGPRFNYTFEFLFKTPGTRNWARVFEMASAVNGYNTIQLGFVENTNSLFFTTSSSRVTGNNAHNIFTFFDDVATSTWYHVAVTVERLNVNQTLQTAYVNGQRTRSAVGYSIDPVSRPIAFIGRSSYAADAYFNGSFDAARIYDYVLKEDVIAALAELTNTAQLQNTTIVPRIVSSSSSSSTAAAATRVSSSTSSSAGRSSSSISTGPSRAPNSGIVVTRIAPSDLPKIVTGTTVGSSYYNGNTGAFNALSWGQYFPFTFIVTVSGVYRLDLCAAADATFDSGMYLLRGAFSDTLPATASFNLAYDDDSCGGSSLQPLITHELTANTNYTIVIAGFGGLSNGMFQLEIALPPTPPSSSTANRNPALSSSSSGGGNPLLSSTSSSGGGSNLATSSTSSGGDGGGSKPSLSSTGGDSGDDGGSSNGATITIIVIVLLLVVVGGGVGGYFYWKRSASSVRRGDVFDSLEMNDAFMSKKGRGGVNALLGETDSGDFEYKPPSIGYRPPSSY